MIHRVFVILIPFNESDNFYISQLFYDLFFHNVLYFWTSCTFPDMTFEWLFFTSFNPWKNNQSLHGIFSTALIMIFWWTWLNVWKTTMLQFTSFYLYVWMFFLKWLICFIKIEKQFFLHRFYSPICTIKTKSFITGSCLDMSSLWWNSCTRFKVSCRKSCLCAHCFLLFCRAGNI